MTLSKLPRKYVVLGVVLAVLIAATTAVAARPRLGPPHCAKHTVVRGDTAMRVARDYGIPWNTFVERNGHIADLSLIYPGDELVLSCPEPPPVEEAPAPPPIDLALVTESEAMVPMTDQPQQLMLSETAFAEPGRLNAHGLVIVLYNAGFRGNALVTMAATCKGESGGRIAAVGDQHLVNGKWGPSYGICQVRSLNNQRGTGQTRDGDLLVDPLFNARAAWEISGGGSNFRPWTVFQKGIWKKYADEMRSAAIDLGVLEG